jgi:succinyl-diaminopimelate desuccinylase
MPVPPASVTDLLCDLIAIPSVNPMGRDLSGPEFFETRLTEYLASLFETLGVPYEVIEVVPGRSNVVARFDPPGATTTLLLDAHQDTVPVDGMTISPFEPSVSDGRVWGRGASDVKGGLASMLWAFARLVREQPEGAANIIMSCTCDEEQTTLGITDLCSYWETPGRSKLVTQRPDGAVIAEPTLLDVVVAHRGATRFRIHTGGRACHSSDPTQGVNAIYRMAKVLNALEEYADILPGQRDPHPLCGPSTISVGRIYGGASVNVVPDECAIEIDRRIIPGEDHEEALARIREFLSSRLDFEITYEDPWLNGPTLSDDDNGWLSSSLLEIIAEVDGPHQAVGVPYGTHASRTCRGGVPSVVFGPGSIAQAHTKDEWIEIEQLEKAAEVYFRYCSSPPAAPK